MKGNRKTYTKFQLASSVLMILALLWLTVSLPFVYASQQELASQDNIINNGTPLAGNEEEAANPFGNSTEEKSPGNGNSFSEEYLHDHHKSDAIISVIAPSHKFENADTYVAFHGELLVPPPNKA